MKKSIFVICIAIVLATASFSCKKTLSTIFGGVDANAPTAPFELIAITSPLFVGTEYKAGEINTTFKLDSIIRANTAGVFGVGSVNSIKVKKITIDNPDGTTLNNLSNLESFRIELTSNNNTTPVEFVKATFPDTPNLYSYTNTPTTNIELLGYLKDTDLKYIVYGKLRRVTTQKLTLNITVTLHIE